ncbi:hypothetical protein BGZ65_003154, partial [Modicella reniformis]
MSRNVDALRITEIDVENKAIVLHSQVSQALQRVYPASTSHRHSNTVHSDTENNPTPQAQIYSLQQQIDDILKQIQQMNHQMQHQQQQVGQVINEQQQHMEKNELQHEKRIDNILQQVQDMKRDDHQKMQQIHGLNEGDKESSVTQRFQLEYDRLMVIKYRTQALLATSFLELLSPRLFIVLPKASDMVDKDGRPCSLLFRLYYLCECGTHTMSESSKGRHEIHMADHPGYDLDNHSTFFDKYGSYLLAMMYMVKYGAVAAGRVVPPLANLRLAEGIDTDKGHLSRQVDDTITYLEDTLHINKNDMDPISHWEADHPELYLKTIKGQSAFGNLHPTTTQDRHCVWVCNEHRREYHESTMQQLKEVIIANNEEYNEEAGKIKIKIKAVALAQRLYDAMRQVRWIQNLDNQWSLTALDLKFGYHRLIKTSTAHILINLNNIDSLELEVGKLLLSTGVSADGTQYMKIEVEKLSDLTLVDLAFVQQCHHKEFAIKNTPLESDEDRLVNILEHSSKLEVLRIGCLAGRASTIINLVTSTREKNLQCDKPVSLRTLEMMDEGLIISDEDGIHHIATTLKFTEETKVFDMRTRIKLQKYGAISQNDPMCDFFRQYGWSIEILKLVDFNDQLASSLYDGIQRQDSQI